MPILSHKQYELCWIDPAPNGFDHAGVPLTYPRLQRG